MVVVTYSDFRKNLKENLDNICDNKDLLIVARPHNKNVVVISLDEYNSWKETMYLSSTSNNRKRLEDAIRNTELGVYETHALIEE